jgi:D-sedoheptulose 7-phosphate isomerase
MKSKDDHHRRRIKTHLLESAEVKQRVAELCMESILAAAVLVEKAFRSGGKVLLCGNGGSAADCQHMATELIGRLSKEFERPGLPAIALTTNTSFLTAHSNDFNFESVFERQVQVLGRPGDVLIGISTSGNSVNIIRAFEAAKAMDISTIALTGNQGRLMTLGDVTIAVPSEDTQYIQEAHLAIEHILCELLERSLFSSEKGKPGL